MMEGYGGFLVVSIDQIYSFLWNRKVLESRFQRIFEKTQSVYHTLPHKKMLFLFGMHFQEWDNDSSDW